MGAPYIFDIGSLRFNDLTLILLTWRKWWAPNNTSKQQMGFNSAFKGFLKRPWPAQGRSANKKKDTQTMTEAQHCVPRIFLFHGGNFKTIFNIPRNPYTRKRKHNKQAIVSSQRLLQYCQLMHKNSAGYLEGYLTFLWQFKICIYFFRDFSRNAFFEVYCVSILC